MATLALPNVDAALYGAQSARQTETTSSLVSEADKAKMKTKAKEFESFFIYQVIELMKPQIDSEFTGGPGEDMFRHTLNEHIAEGITNAGGVGLTDTVYKQLLKQQEMRATTLANAAGTYAATAAQ